MTDSHFLLLRLLLRCLHFGGCSLAGARAFQTAQHSFQINLLMSSQLKDVLAAAFIALCFLVWFAYSGILFSLFK